VIDQHPLPALAKRKVFLLSGGVSRRVLALDQAD